MDYMHGVHGEDANVDRNSDICGEIRTYRSAKFKIQCLLKWLANNEILPHRAGCGALPDYCRFFFFIHTVRHIEDESPIMFLRTHDSYFERSKKN